MPLHLTQPSALNGTYRRFPSNAIYQPWDQNHAVHTSERSSFDGTSPCPYFHRSYQTENTVHGAQSKVPHGRHSAIGSLVAQVEANKEIQVDPRSHSMALNTCLCGTGCQLAPLDDSRIMLV